ncbi:serine/cysteine peptidase [Ralstonia solanacearum]|nr:serine/cysteine peptidase [Ralstonia solanacearum]NKF88892.1 serine/cysteine peptidase [Ralstonia solanacearum]NKF95046.1 serine/cysteine peptidase [Ralstonia solanacearum]NKG11141.1 serine/cysteine peptidase [Ralstonia solanacearum]
MLETIGEAALAVAKTRHAIAVATLADAVRPVYRADDRGQPDHEGSCVLLQLGGTKYALTASHVVEAGKIADSDLYIGGESRFVKISGTCYRSPAPRGILKDHYDFALVTLSDDDISSLGDIKYISEASISKGQTQSDGHVYTVIGYPNTKNKDIDKQLRAVTSNRWNYYSVPRDGTDVSRKIEVDGGEHIFVGYDKRSLDVNGNQVNSIKLKGVSGGAVIDLGRLGAPENLSPDAAFTPRLVALFIEHHPDKQITVATKIGFIIESLGLADIL